MSEKLPLELLKEKYMPLKEFVKKYHIPEDYVLKLINTHRVRSAEFRVPGERLRCIHVNPEEILPIYKEEHS